MISKGNKSPRNERVFPKDHVPEVEKTTRKLEFLSSCILEQNSEIQRYLLLGDVAGWAHTREHTARDTQGGEVALMFIRQEPAGRESSQNASNGCPWIMILWVISLLAFDHFYSFRTFL